jgi:hypothetical protein
VRVLRVKLTIGAHGRSVLSGLSARRCQRIGLKSGSGSTVVTGTHVGRDSHCRHGTDYRRDRSANAIVTAHDRVAESAMRLPQGLTVCLMCLAVVAAGACSNQRASAQRLLKDIDSSMAAAFPDASQYAPDDLMEVEKKAAALKASFATRDYKSVVKGAPPVLAAAQALASTALVKKEQERRKMQSQWAALAAEVPGDINSVRSRIDFLSLPGNKKLASGVDLETAKGGLADARLLWTNAQQAYGSQHFVDAMADGNGAKAKVQALAASMKMDFSQPAAVADTALDH